MKNELTSNWHKISGTSLNGIPKDYKKWCQENIGMEYNSENPNGKWYQFMEKIYEPYPKQIYYLRYMFLNKEDVTLFAMRWA
jgi:hypothetical protein